MNIHIPNPDTPVKAADPIQPTPPKPNVNPMFAPAAEAAKAPSDAAKPDEGKSPPPKA